MATWRMWRINLVILLAVAAGILTAACSSNPERVVTEPGGDAQSDEVDTPSEAMESFLAGTVWIVDDLDTITPPGADSNAPAISFTTEVGLVLTMTDACGSLRLGLYPDGSGSHLVERDDKDLEICDDLYGRFFAEATLLTLERNDSQLIVRSGSSVLRASHVVSDSAHPDGPTRTPTPIADPHAGIDVPWCADVVKPQPRFQGSLRFNQNPDDVPMGVLHTYGEENRDRFGGIWIDRDNGGVVVIGFTDDPAHHRSALSERSPSPDDLAVTDPPPRITDARPLGEQDFIFDVVQVEFTLDELDAMRSSLRLGPEEGRGSSGLQTDINRVVIEFIDPPPDRFSSIVDALPPGICVGDVHLTPVVPKNIELLDSDGRLVATVVQPNPLSYRDAPAADSTAIELTVWTGCGDQSVLSRGPDVIETADRVIVAVAEVPSPGQACPSIATGFSITVELSAPLGDRVLWNAGLNEPIDGDPYR